MKIGIADLREISKEEKAWIIKRSWPFAAYHISDSERYNVLMLNKDKIHEDFNPDGCLKFYIQRTTSDFSKAQLFDVPDEVWNPNEPLYLPTGTFSVDHGMQVMRCVDGFLHDASGFPALTTSLFGDEYYLYGKNYEPIEYFRYLEETKWRYPEYQPQKYVEFMASVLGKKES